MATQRQAELKFCIYGLSDFTNLSWISRYVKHIAGWISPNRL